MAELRYLREKVAQTHKTLRTFKSDRQEIRKMGCHSHCWYTGALAILLARQGCLDLASRSGEGAPGKRTQSRKSVSSVSGNWSMITRGKSIRAKLRLPNCVLVFPDGADCSLAGPGLMHLGSVEVGTW